MGAVQALALALEMREPILLWGDPGIGKTALVNAIGAVLGRPVFEIIVSLHEPTDFTGLPALVETGVDGQKVMRFFPMEQIIRLVESRYGIAFLDEFSNGSMDIQKAVMQFSHARRAGYVDLPPAVSLAAAANPPESNAGGGDLTPALANRWLHLEMELDADAWTSGMDSGWPAPDLYRLPMGWERGKPAATALVTGFIRKAGKSLLHAMPKSGSREAGRAWPSPRTWDKVISIEAACTAALADDQTRELLVAGAVGQGAAHEYATYRKDRDLPSAQDVLANPRRALDDREDRMQRILEGTMQHVRTLITGYVLDGAESAASEVWGEAWGVLGAVGAQHPDVALPFARALTITPAAVLPDGSPRFSIPMNIAGGIGTVLMGDI